MNCTDLIKALKEMGIPEHWYKIGDKGISHDRTVLRYADGQWLVYYSERGQTHQLEAFKTEDEACRELLRRMQADKEDNGSTGQGEA